MSALVLALPESASLATRVSELAAMPLGTVESRQFPDGETYLRIDAECADRTVVLVCRLDRPNDKILPLYSWRTPLARWAPDACASWRRVWPTCVRTGSFVPERP